MRLWLWASFCFFFFQLRVLGRIGFERFLSSQSPLDIGTRHVVFFCKSVAQDRQAPSVEEIENPVVHSALPYPQLVDAVPEEVGKRSPQFMPKNSQALNRGNTILIRPLVGASNLLQPIEHRNIVFVFLVENDISMGHLASASTLSQYCYRFQPVVPAQTAPPRLTDPPRFCQVSGRSVRWPVTHR